MKQFSGIAALFLLALSHIAAASPPATLGYEGSLADSGGAPITATLGITFRLYDVQSGGTALWNETQAGVQVDGGNLSVELGSVTPLPQSLFGKKLYLGIQIAGDSEMMPRPALTASPFAFRAASVLNRTRFVSAEGSALENGAALVAAVALAGSQASSASPIVVTLDAGDFDLDVTQLVVPPYVTLTGQGRTATFIRSAAIDGTLRLRSHTALYRVSVTNTGIASATPGAVPAYAVAVIGDNPASDSFVEIAEVRAIASAPGSTTGNKNAMYFCRATDLNLHDAELHGEGGRNAGTTFFTCLPGNARIRMRNLHGYSTGGDEGNFGFSVRGADVDAQDLTSRVFVGASSPIRYASGMSITAEAGSTVRIDGARVEIETAPGVEILRSWGVDQFGAGAVELRNTTIDMHVRAPDVYGVFLRAVESDAQATYDSVDINVVASVVAGTTPLAAGFDLGGAGPRINNSRVRVECAADSLVSASCYGVMRYQHSVASVLQPLQGTVLIEDSVVETNALHNPPSFPAVVLSPGGLTIRRSSVRALGQTQAVIAYGLATPPTDPLLEVRHSFIESGDATTPIVSCALQVVGSTGQLIATHNTVRGVTCAEPAIVKTCLGNATSTGSFLTTTCP